MILGENGEKMSKSRGNVVTPDDFIDEIGADAFRLYEMFMGAFEQAIPWSMNGVRGCKRFLDRVWRLQEIVDLSNNNISKALSFDVNCAIKKVSDDYEDMKYNTAVATLMTLVNSFYEVGKISAGDLKALLLLLSPVSPHICEEIWEGLGFGGHVYNQKWPSYDEKAMVKAEVEIAVQINGKVRARINVPSDLTEEDAKALVPNLAELKPFVEGKQLQKLIFVKGRLVNLILK